MEEVEELSCAVVIASPDERDEVLKEVLDSSAGVDRPGVCAVTEEIGVDEETRVFVGIDVDEVEFPLGAVKPESLADPND